MNKILFSILKVSFLIAISCSTPKTTISKNMPQQGIEGYVYRVSGNQMPAPDAKPSQPRGIKTVLYIYQLTNLNQVQRYGQSSFYRAIRTNYVAKVESDSSGYFKINLAPGKYSLFAKKDDLFFSNSFDKDNNISPTEVLPEKFSNVEFRIDYDAVY